jgi:hypothetical protein
MFEKEDGNFLVDSLADIHCTMDVIGRLVPINLSGVSLTWCSKATAGIERRELFDREFRDSCEQEIYAGLRISSYRVALYGPPLLTSVVSLMTVPYRSVEDNQRTRLSTSSNFS